MRRERKANVVVKETAVVASSTDFSASVTKGEPAWSQSVENSHSFPYSDAGDKCFLDPS
jgi:hypothetical protein